MALSMHYNGTDLSGASYGLTVLETEAPFMAKPQVDVQGVAQWFGGISRSPGFDALTIPVPCVVSGSSASDLLTKLDALRLVLNPRNGQKTLKFDYMSNRYWYAVLANPGDLSAVGVSWKKFNLVFVAGDSRAYSTSDRATPDFTINTNPYTMTETPAGTATADPIWIIKNTSGGTVTSLTLNNTTTVESVTWVGSLANGDWLKVDIPRGVIEKSTDSGANYTDSMSGVSGSFILPTLKPSVVNSITLTGFSAATVVLTYTARYL